eukprot:g5354.t1
MISPFCFLGAGTSRGLESGTSREMAMRRRDLTEEENRIRDKAKARLLVRQAARKKRGCKKIDQYLSKSEIERNRALAIARAKKILQERNIILPSNFDSWSMFKVGARSRFKQVDLQIEILESPTLSGLQGFRPTSLFYRYDSEIAMAKYLEEALGKSFFRARPAVDLVSSPNSHGIAGIISARLGASFLCFAGSNENILSSARFNASMNCEEGFHSRISLAQIKWGETLHSRGLVDALKRTNSQDTDRLIVISVNPFNEKYKGNETIPTAVEGFDLVGPNRLASTIDGLLIRGSQSVCIVGLYIEEGNQGSLFISAAKNLMQVSEVPTDAIPTLFRMDGYRIFFIQPHGKMVCQVIDPFLSLDSNEESIEDKNTKPTESILPLPANGERLLKAMIVDAPSTFNAHSVVNSLLLEGRCVIDNFLPLQWIRSALKETRALVREANAENSEKNLRLMPGGDNAEHRSDICLDFDPFSDDFPNLAQYCRLIQFTVAKQLTLALRDKAAETGTIPEELYPRERPQFALYPGKGTHYKAHVDNPRVMADPNNDPIDNGRRITCTFYLNSEWSVEDGGSLRMYGIEGKQGMNEVDFEEISPIANRMVFFLSDRVVHEVLPAQKDRIAITIWLTSAIQISASAAEAHQKLDGAIKMETNGKGILPPDCFPLAAAEEGEEEEDGLET